MEIKVKCQGCGNEMTIDEDATEVEYHGPLMVKVSECETCSETAFDKGKAEGVDTTTTEKDEEYSEAVAEAHTEGFDEGGLAGYDRGFGEGKEEGNHEGYERGRNEGDREDGA